MVTTRQSWTGVIGVALLLTAVLAVLLTAFAWPATTSEPRDVPVVVAGPQPAASQASAALEQDGAFAATPVGGEVEAREAVEQREAYGALVLGPDGATMLTASAASAPVAQILTQVAQGIGAETGTPVAVEDVVAAPESDPRGAGLAAGALPLVLGGILTAALLSRLVAGVAHRLVGAVLVAVAGGLALTGILQGWLGALDGDYWVNSAVVALGVAAVSLTLLGLESLFGVVGLGLGSVTMVLLGNPLSGAASAPEMLPSGWGELGQLLPPGATVTLLRSVAFFDGAAAAAPATVLAVWATVGLVLCLLGGAVPLDSVTRRRRPAAGEGVDAGGQQEDAARDDEVQVRLDAQESQPVGDDRDHEPTEQRVPGTSAAAEEARPTDDGGPDGVEQGVAGAGVRRHRAQA